MGARAKNDAFDLVDYPDSDGKPMAESDRHRDEMNALIDMLRRRYRDDPKVYVSGNLFIYYEQGVRASVFAPDAFVVFGVPNKQRKTYKLWEERKVPAIVLEVSSKTTWREDLGDKKAVAERLGIIEYFVIDLEGDYLDPPLRGWRLGPEGYVPVETPSDGSLRAETLGLDIALDGMRIVLRDARTGEAILRPENLESESRAAREGAERAREDAERAREDAERAREDARAALLRTKRAAVLAVLSARSLAPTAAERARVETCTDASLLDVWLHGAATCATVEEALGAR